MTSGIVVSAATRGRRLILEVRSCETAERCVLGVDGACAVQFGDYVRWHGRYAYWTPAGMQRKNVPLPMTLMPLGVGAP